MRSHASTAFINPPHISTKLTIQQVWKGLQIKARKPNLFVPMITDCQIISDEGIKLVRKVQFGKEKPFVEEVITSYEPTIVYFEMSSTGTRITNQISYSPSPFPELLLTFSFANNLPGFSPEEQEGLSDEEINERIGKGVEGTLEKIRELVRGGEIV